MKNFLPTLNVFLFCAFACVFAPEREISCPSLCPPGEKSIIDKNGVPKCAKSAQLHEKCEPGTNSAVRCQPTYSICKNNVCSCLNGFIELNGHCISETVKCPGVERLQSAMECRVVLDICTKSSAEQKTSMPSDDTEPSVTPTTTPCSSCGGVTSEHDIVSKQEAATADLDLSERLHKDDFSCVPSDFSPLFTTDKINKSSKHSRIERHTFGSRIYQTTLDCPITHFCLVYGAYSVQGCTRVGYGHCCPHSCPLGEPHPNATCDAAARITCNDQEGYYCRRSYLTEETLRIFGRHVDSVFLATCCPQHCPAGTVALNDGQCIHMAGFGEACWRDEQCPETTVCREGLCQCEQTKRYMTSDQNVNGLCVVKLKTDSTRIGHYCNDIIYPSCEADHSTCVNGRCSCVCGYEENQNNECLKRPSQCPGDSNSSCISWAGQGECENNPDWMKINCAKSCNSC